jgi:hypothetical protein
MIYYAGIGSRETPKDMLLKFEHAAMIFAKKGFVLRSGGAKGADSAFEIGCDSVRGQKEIFLPWKGFENSSSTLYNTSGEALKIAEEFHPYWSKLSDGARKLQARNCYQVLGYDLKTPSSFIICWTKNGSGSGGTGQAIRIAKAHNIPVFDMGGNDGVAERLNNFINSLKINKERGNA